MIKRSFSQLNSAEECMFSHYLSKIKKVEGIENYWSELGTIVHSILEEYDKGLVTNCADEFTLRYGKITSDIRQAAWDKGAYKWKTYGQILKFFQNFKGFNTKAIFTELAFEYEIEDFLFTGFIDRGSYINNNPNEGISVQDYKISNKFTKKDLAKKLHQLYLYAPAIKNAYGKYPKEMIFYFVKSGEYYKEAFNEAKLKKSLKWACEANKKIIFAQEQNNFPATVNKFKCANLCSYSEHCEFWNN